MSVRNHSSRVAALLGAALILGFLAPATWAQNAPATEDQPTVSETSTAPAPQPKPGPDPGPFRKGRVRVGFYAGAGESFSQTYAIFGAGLGYYLFNGLEAGIDAEGWVFQSPEIWKVTPQVRYVLWQVAPIRPYVGAFWRQTYVGDNYPDYSSWGGRAGIAVNKGGSYMAVGLVYEKYNNYTGPGDASNVYPEIAFWLSF